jgi:phage gp45-like
VVCRTRSAAVYHSLADGETAIFASEGDAIIILRANGTIEVTGGTVKIGDSAAAALAKAAAISDLQTAINGWVPVPNDGGAALKAALVTWLANTTYSTTKAKGT